MKKLALALLATSTLAVAAPALAQGYYGDNWNPPSYGDFWPQYQHVCDLIDHGQRDGSYTPEQAGHFYRALQSIRYRAMWQKDHGLYDGREINARFDDLDRRMTAAHAEGHLRFEYGGGYGYRPYGDYGRRW